MSLFARRVRLDGFGRARARQLERAAARHGALHASDELVVCAFGRATTIPLGEGLAGVATPSLVADALEDIELEGDSGPGGSGVIALGSLPFDATAKSELFVPSLVCAWQPAGATAWITEVGEDGDALHPAAAMHAIIAGDDRRVPGQSIASMVELPPGRGYASAVAACVARIRAGDAEKVVLARMLRGRATEPIDVAALARALHATEPSCTLYAFPHDGRRFVGASPELLVATSGGAVAAHPLAGTVSLSNGGDVDDQIAWLRASEKNLAEHRLVVEDIVARLSELCDAIGAPATPEVVRLTTVAHLGTWVDGKLAGRHDAHAAMRALAAVHPTPAVGGVPREAAIALIDELEANPRGPWAGPVGWVDADGTSMWTLGLRGLCVVGDTFEAWGGAGIVADSEPQSELDETAVKLASVLRAFTV
jgi:menaquinone-specific isochorismate synthase